MELTAKRVRALMIEQHISQKRLADELQVSTSSINNYLHANRWMNISLLRKVCQSLDTSADYVLGLSEQKHPSKLPDDELILLEMYRTLPSQAKRCATYQLRQLSQLCHLSSVGQPESSVISKHP